MSDPRGRNEDSGVCRLWRYNTAHATLCVTTGFRYGRCFEVRSNNLARQLRRRSCSGFMGAMSVMRMFMMRRGSGAQWKCKRENEDRKGTADFHLRDSPQKIVAVIERA